jgi:hypothetical protein
VRVGEIRGEETIEGGNIGRQHGGEALFFDAGELGLGVSRKEGSRGSGPKGYGEDGD